MLPRNRRPSLRRESPAMIGVRCVALTASLAAGGGLGAPPAWGAQTALRARDTITAVELADGDSLQFTLRNGQTRTVRLIGAGHGRTRTQAALDLFYVTATLEVDGQRLEAVHHYAA